MSYTKESIKKFWMYCEHCGYEITGVYFNPANCPKCRRRLEFLYLTKGQWEKHNEKIDELGCRGFARKFIVRGTILDEGFRKQAGRTN